MSGLHLTCRISLFTKFACFLVSGRQSEEDRRFLVLLSPLRDRQEWFPVLLLLLHLLTEKIKSRIVQEERKPLGISLHLSLLCQFLPPPSLSCLILSGWTFPGSYILFYHSLRPSPSPVLSFSLILFALTLQEFLSLFISTLSFFLCFLIWSLSFTAQVQAHQCCCVAQNKLPFTLNWIKHVVLKLLAMKELMDFKCIHAFIYSSIYFKDGSNSHRENHFKDSGKCFSILAKCLQKIYKIPNGFWAVMSLILWWKIKWSGQRLTDTAPVCQPADILERSIWRRGQQAKMRKTNVRLSMFFSPQTMIIQHCRRTHLRQGQQLLHFNTHRKTSATFSGT